MHIVRTVIKNIFLTVYLITGYMEDMEIILNLILFPDGLKRHHLTPKSEL